MRKTVKIVLLTCLVVTGIQVVPFPFVHAWGGSIICGSVDCFSVPQSCATAPITDNGQTCQNRGGGGGRAFPV